MYRLVSIVMAIMVLLSTMSFTVKKQYCGDFLIRVSFVANVEKFDVSENLEATVKKKDCCKHEVHYIEGQDQLQNESFKKMNFELQKILEPFVVSYSFNYFKSKKYKQFSRACTAPDFHSDLQVLYQVFLI